MFRQSVSVTLLVSLIALGVSGILMIISGSLSFQLQMHPVHKIFGVIMVLSGILHLYFNFNSIQSHLKNRGVFVFGTAMLMLLIFLLVVGINKPMDPQMVEQVQQLLSQIETK